MHKQDLWNKHADNYLAAPSRRSKFVGDAPMANAVVAHKNTKVKQKELDSEKLQAMLSTCLLDLFCDSFPSNRRSHIKAELRTVMVKLNLIPSTYFSEDFLSIRSAFSSMLSDVIRMTLMNEPSIYPQITNSNANFSPHRDRYQTDFDEIEQIGQGGFATVHKVKSRVDNCFYAIKKIKFKRRVQEKSMVVLNEIKVLAQLEHRNVVRYHCGWVDMESTSKQPQPTDGQPSSPIRITEIHDVDTDESSQELSSSPTVEKKTCMKDDLSKGDDERSAEETIESSVSSLSSTSSSSNISAQSDDDNTVSDSDNEEPAPIKKCSGKFWARSSDSTSTELEYESSVAASTKTATVQERREVMDYASVWTPVIFIQMELCNTTLAQFLIDRNESNPSGNMCINEGFNIKLVKQLCSAIDYIHSKHLIHRDIKPSNIFLKEENGNVRLLLGDFGLACVDNVEDETQISNESITVKTRRRRSSSVQTIHSVGVGTYAYAAPEQLVRNDYGPMVDIYSAGVVLFEIYNVFSTDMERLSSIQKLREDRLIEEKLLKSWPSVVEMVLMMTDPDPAKRPKARDLLQMCTHTKTVEDLLDMIHLKDQLIKNRDEQIKSHEKEIDTLKKEVARLKTIIKTNQ